MCYSLPLIDEELEGNASHLVILFLLFPLTFSTMEENTREPTKPKYDTLGICSFQTLSKLLITQVMNEGNPTKPIKTHYDPIQGVGPNRMKLH